MFLEDYDIAVARTLYQGADVWLNNPRRPLEACGTQRHEGGAQRRAQLLDPRRLVGRVVRRRERLGDLVGRGRSTTSTAATRSRPNSLFELLEHQIVPLFYERSEGPVPRRWVGRMKHVLRSLGPQVTAARMVRDYVDRAVRADGGARRPRSTRTSTPAAQELAAWKAAGRARRGRRAASIDVETDDGVGRPRRDARRSRRRSTLGDLDADDVEVQLLHGPVGQGDELVDADASCR